jgi:hypothetical protein
MRAKLLGLLIGLGLAAFVAPALANCSGYHSASDSQSSTQQTAQSQPAQGGAD